MTSAARSAAVGIALATIAAGAWPASPTHKAATAPAAAASPASAAASSPPAAPVEFTGTFTAGTTYSAVMFYDARVLKTWRPVKDVQPGANVAWTVAWTNLEQFPALKTPATQARQQRFRFRVVKTDIVSGSPQLPWMATYRCEVLAAEPMTALAPHQQQPPVARRH